MVGVWAVAELGNLRVHYYFRTLRTVVWEGRVPACLGFLAGVGIPLPFALRYSLPVVLPVSVTPRPGPAGSKERKIPMGGLFSCVGCRVVVPIGGGVDASD